MKNEKMDKLMRKARVNMKMAKLKAADFAKEAAQKLDAAWNAANKAVDEYRQDIAEKLNKKEQEKISAKKCNCDCCHCHDKDGDSQEKQPNVSEAVEPVFEMNEMEEVVEEESKDEE